MQLIHQSPPVQVLLSASADQHALDSEGRTALDYAGLLEDGTDMVALLSSLGGSGMSTGSHLFAHLWPTII